MKHIIAQRWHFSLTVMLKYVTEFNQISSVKEYLNINKDLFLTLTRGKLEKLTDFIKVLWEVGRVARQLEVDKKLSMSQYPTLFRERF